MGFAGSRQKVSPLKDFGEAVGVEVMDDGSDGSFRADDENFDGFAIGLGVAVELERKLKTDGFGGLGGRREQRLSLHGESRKVSSNLMTAIIVNRIDDVN